VFQAAAKTSGFRPDHLSKGAVTMRFFTVTLLTLLLLVRESRVFAAADVLDCQHKSLADAVRSGKEKDQTINFTGTCAGPIVIDTDGLTLNGVGTAIIDGDGEDAVRIVGAANVSLSNFEVRNGLNGIAAVNGAHFTMSGVDSHDNTVFGVTLQTSSSAVLSNVTTTHNGLHGLDLQTGSSATLRDSFTTSNNRVFGINTNGSSITFARATVSATNNALGIQIATSASAFINDSVTTINVVNNLSTGLTIVSGAHMVSFGGTINASGNPANGVSVNSKGGLDLDAGSTLNSFNNGNGLQVQQNSVVTVFNTPQFSGVPGFSTVNVHNNTGIGVRVLSGAVLSLTNQARVLSTQNGRGLVADNGAAVTLVNSTITGNTLPDITLTFGSRADLQTLTFGTYTCDDTVLVRGSSGITCPH
jgi:Right handed beta helix region